MHVQMGLNESWNVELVVALIISELLKQWLFSHFHQTPCSNTIIYKFTNDHCFK